MSLYMFRALNAHLREDTLYTCSIWYCHSLREFVVACRCTVCTLHTFFLLQRAIHSITEKILNRTYL